MTSVNKTNLSTAQINAATQKAETKQPEPQKNKYFTAPNVVLGSLATVGVLGMADVLICKGKHLNKLTGKSKELKEALGRATAAEGRATTAEAKLQSAEAKLEEMAVKSDKSAEQIKAFREQIAQLERKFSETVDNNEGLKARNQKMLKHFQKLYDVCDDFEPETTKYIKKEITRQLRGLGYKMVEPADLEFTKLSDEGFSRFYSYERADIDSIDITANAIVDAKNNVILQGHCFVPQEYAK